ncbi:hypothetical protein CRG98_026089 [Punica granatum]|uniref:Uncharacterized protein n=1 Tax=Punica granatum TaxID=22663 RepID=A0A2I0JBE0_PUNGR|nr:hypothetical protein CRG98_026089 [Punica granatum]
MYSLSLSRSLTYRSLQQLCPGAAVEDTDFWLSSLAAAFFQVHGADPKLHSPPTQRDRTPQRPLCSGRGERRLSCSRRAPAHTPPQVADSLVSSRPQLAQREFSHARELVTENS